MTVSVITLVGPRWCPVYLAAAGAVLHRNDHVVQWAVVCDGSDPAAVRAAVGDDPRIQVVGSATNHGTAQARNAGLAAATGTWVYALDADDVPLPFGVDVLLAAAVDHGTVWAAGLGVDVDADGETVVYKPPPELAPFHEVIPVGGFLAQADRTGVYPVLCSGATILTTEVARAAGGWDEELRIVSEDISLIAWVSERHAGGWCPDYVLAYRKHPNSQTAMYRDRAIEGAARRRVRARAHAGLQG